MPHVITQPCCNDASCVPVCPVSCIHPAPGEPGFATTEMLYIDPDTCIDCGICIESCPVAAIVPDYDLPEGDRYEELNSLYYQQYPLTESQEQPEPEVVRAPVGTGTLRVAIVGTGPAGSYAAAELLSYPNTEVTMFDRLPTPWGLVRAGVAPDHPGTKEVTKLFESLLSNARLRFHLNVEIGAHLSHAELLERHHAVIYAYGASGGHRLEIAGSALPGSISATEFVNWYNGHPDFAELSPDLSGNRAVVIGQGNVALDVARLLVAGPDELARTDMADHAIAALGESNIEEVVVMGRRGPAQAAYTTPELLALGSLPGVDVVVDTADAQLDELSRAQLAGPDTAPSARVKAAIPAEFAARPTTPGNKRIVLRYFSSPLEITGEDQVTGLRVGRNELERNESGRITARATGHAEIIDTGLVLHAVGYQGKPIPGVPFDGNRHVVPNTAGRVTGAAGIYTTGWIKRGPTGVIGTNRVCAQETVTSLVADFVAGVLAEPEHSDLAELVAQRQPDAVDISGWRSIDRAERSRGRAQGRPRSKLITVPELLAASR